MKKKVVSIMMTAALAAGMLAGCEIGRAHV